MIVLDRGRWQPEGATIRREDRAWLLIKSDDQFARGAGYREIAEEETTSQLSGRTNAELAATGEIRKDHAARVTAAKARKASLPTISKLSALARGCSRLSSSRASQRGPKLRWLDGQEIDMMACSAA